MDILIATARNITHTVRDEDKDGAIAIEPTIEAVLTTYGKRFEVIGLNTDIVKTMHCNTIRFGLSPESARKLATSLVEWADEAEEQRDSISYTPTTPDSP